MADINSHRIESQEDPGSFSLLWMGVPSLYFLPGRAGGSELCLAGDFRTGSSPVMVLVRG